MHNRLVVVARKKIYADLGLYGAENVARATRTIFDTIFMAFVTVPLCLSMKLLLRIDVAFSSV